MAAETETRHMPIDTHAAGAADPLYRKKTLTKAAQWFCNGHAKTWAQSAVREMSTHFEIDTREGTLRGEPGDWIACGPAGEVYPIGKEIFAATYELATASPAPEALADLRALSEAASPGEWGVYAEPVSDVTQAENEVLHQVRSTPNPQGHMFMLNAGGLCPAVTGWGERSEANAHLICALVNAYRSDTLLASSPAPRAPAVPEERDGGAFAEWSTADLAGQCRMQAREMLDPELSRFFIALSDRLRTFAAAPAAPPADGGTEGQGVKARAMIVVAAGGSGIYIASKTSHAARWRAMRAAGTPIVSTWIDEADKGETACFADLWSRCVDEAATAGALVIYMEPGEVLKGAFVEAGAALSCGVPVYAVGCDEFSFTNHTGVTRCASLADAFEAALSSRTLAGAAGDPVGEAGFVSATCGGERCSVCGQPATAKIGEEIAFDDPHPNRHNLTAYVCAEHFNAVLRPTRPASPAPTPSPESTLSPAQVAPVVEGFAINPEGGPDIIVNGIRRFVSEYAFLTYKGWAQRRISDLEAALARHATLDGAGLTKARTWPQHGDRNPCAGEGESSHRWDAMQGKWVAEEDWIASGSATPQSAGETAGGRRLFEIFQREHSTTYPHAFHSEWADLSFDLQHVWDRTAAIATAAPEQAGSRGWESQAASDVLAERRRQIEAEDWSAEHDDGHTGGEIATAAGCYAIAASVHGSYIWRTGARPLGASPLAMPERWPWGQRAWKPKNYRCDLVRAGALIIADIERFDRRVAAARPHSDAEGRS